MLVAMQVRDEELKEIDETDQDRHEINERSRQFSCWDYSCQIDPNVFACVTNCRPALFPIRASSGRSSCPTSISEIKNYVRLTQNRASF